MQLVMPHGEFKTIDKSPEPYPDVCVEDAGNRPTLRIFCLKKPAPMSGFYFIYMLLQIFLCPENELHGTLTLDYQDPYPQCPYRMKTYILSCLVAMLAALGNLSAQYTPTLEFASVGGPSGSGPSIAAKSVTFENNTNNPSGNGFVAFTAPTTTVTFSLSNQQYPLSATYSSTGASVVFGGGNNLGQKAINGLNYYYTMGNYSAPVNGDFTSAGTITAGTGMDITANYSLQIFTSVMGLYAAGTSSSGTYYMADLTITFNTLVTNPVIHFIGLGGVGGGLGFSNEFTLVTPSLTLTRLSGSTEFAVSGTQILNTAATIGGTTGSGGASGSVLVNGTNISSLTFNVNMRGDGSATTWPNPSGNTSGDGFMIGVSLLTVNSILPLSITDFTATSASTGAQLQWNAAAGANSSFFDAESSRDGATWQDIAMVMATGDDHTTYAYSDPSAAAGNNYYRIKEVNAAGNAVYSPVKTVYIDVPSAAKLFPNPVRNRLFITGNGSAVQSVIVTAADGREMSRYTGLVAGKSIDMSSLPAGMYFVTIGYVSGSKQTTSIVKY